MKKEIKKRTKRNKERSLLFLLFFLLYLSYINTLLLYIHIYIILLTNQNHKKNEKFILDISPW